MKQLWFAVAAIPVWTAIQLAAGWSAYPPATWNALLSWGANLAILTVAIVALPGRRLLGWLFYFGFAISVLGTAQMFTSGGKVFWIFPSGYTDHVIGPFVSRNVYAMFIELLLPIGLYFAATEKRRSWIYLAMCGAMLGSVIASASRAGVVLATGEVLAVMLLLRGRRAWALAAILVVLAGGTEAWRRFEESDPLAGRREMLLSSGDMARARPWTGFGLGTWRVVYPAYARYDDGTAPEFAHNDWAQAAAEGGAPLLAMLLGIAVLSIRPAARSVWGIGVIALWLHGLVDAPLQNPVLAGWLFLVLGVAAGEASFGGRGGKDGQLPRRG